MFKNKIKLLTISIAAMCVLTGNVWAQQTSCEEAKQSMRSILQEMNPGITEERLDQLTDMQMRGLCEGQEWISNIRVNMQKAHPKRDAKWIAQHKPILECYQNTCEQKSVHQSEDESVFNVIDGIIVGYSGKGGNLVIPNSIDGQEITAIGVRAFENKGIITVVIPDGVIEIGDYAFANNKIQSVNIGKNVVNIREGAFRHNLLEEVTIPQSVRSIGSLAFVNYVSTQNVNGTNWQILRSNVRRITIGDNVKIAQDAFGNGYIFTCFGFKKRQAGTYRWRDNMSDWRREKK